MAKQETYKFTGAVYHFEHCETSKWICFTRASSVEQARSRCIYRYKMEHGYAANAKISLEGIFEKVA